MKRLVIVQALMFVGIAALVVPLGIGFVAGPEGLRTPMRLHATMTDAFGLTSGTSVTVRGVEVGAVGGVRLGPDGIADVELAVRPGTQIPRDSIMTVGMGTAAGIQSVDILPQSAGGPYLESGDTIAAPADRQPVQMDRVMQEAARLVKNIDAEAVGGVFTELSDSFTGLGPELATLIDNGHDISSRMRDQSGRLQRLIDGTAELVTTMAAQSGSFVRGMHAGARFAAQLDAAGPVFLHLTDQSPAMLRSVQQLMDTYRGTFGDTLANLAVVAPIVGNRTESLETGLTAIPEGLTKLASIVKGDRADFALIATQGPVCVHNVDRRTIGDVTPVEPDLALYCPPAPDMLMRGASNAPRPDDLGTRNWQTPGSQIGPPVALDPVQIPTLAEVVYKWRMILKGSYAPR
ncbi:MAG: MCE family protein [Actinomycetota bacterium]|nr:MCE family protein [Actinomycetota bacterium]